MNKLVFQIIALFILGLSLTSFASPQGESDLASEHHFAGYRFVGQVKMISYDLPLTVRFRNLNKGAVNAFETVKICDIYDNTLLTVSQARQIEMFKDAIKSGTLLEVSYNSQFERCLTGATLHSSEKKEELQKSI